LCERLAAGGPPSPCRWLSDYLESVRAIYAIRVYPEAMREDPTALDAVYAIRTALRDAVGGIGQWDGHGFTNEDDHLIWCDPADFPQGVTTAAILDESTGEWVPFEINLSDPEELAEFLRGEIPRAARFLRPPHPPADDPGLLRPPHRDRRPAPALNGKVLRLKYLVFPVALYLIIMLLLLGGAAVVGLLLRWFAPAVGLGTALLIGLVATG